ncbi:hypothetical protein X777_03704, partial [Ooceraea biroi]
VDLTRDDRHRHSSHRREEKKHRIPVGEWRTGEEVTGGEPRAREDVTKRNPNVGRKSPVTWLRQHAIVSGIIKHIGSICPWKRNTLSPRAIQERLIDLCPPDRSAVRSLSLSLSRPLVARVVSVYRNVAPIVEQPSPDRLDRGSAALRDRADRERLLPDDRSYWLYQPQPTREGTKGN